MAGLVPAIHVFAELNRRQENCQTGSGQLFDEKQK